MKKFALTLILLLIGFSYLKAQFNSKITSDKYVDYVDSLKDIEKPYVFPIWGEKVQAMGYDLPLPVGLMAGFMHLNQDLNIENLAVGFGSSELVDISELVVFDQINARTDVFTFRPDLWIFPFMNIYGILNKFTANTSVSLAEPFPLVVPEINNDGYGGGFGTTLAYGIEPIWFSGNFNWAWSKTPVLVTPTQSFSTSLRIGTAIHDKRRKHTVSIWVGASYINYRGNSGGSYDMTQLIPDDTNLAQELLDNLNEFLDPGGKYEDFCNTPGNRAKCLVLDPILDEFKGRVEDKLSETFPLEELPINYTFNNSPAEPWNMVAGAQYHFNKQWEVRVEGGFLGRTSIMANVNYRLGFKRRK